MNHLISLGTFKVFSRSCGFIQKTVIQLINLKTLKKPFVSFINGLTFIIGCTIAYP